MAKRAGMEKSILSRWLNAASARISLPMLLSIAASEGFSVAGLMRGDLTRTALPRDVFPDRVPRRLPSQLPSVLLMEIRRAIGESKIRKPMKALNLGVALQSEIAKAASRIVVAVAANRYQLH